MRLSFPMHRRSFLALTALALPAAHASTAESVEQARSEIWRRFIDKHGVMIDFTNLDGSVILPTPEECRMGKPNALGWWSPIENGAMFNGMYIDAAINRWKKTKSPEAARDARRLMEGLLFLASISKVKGFVGRGVTTDGRSHYPMGSNDQTTPWFYGLWQYLQSGLADSSERKRIERKLVTTAEAILELDWLMPAEQPFGTRGTFRGHTFTDASRLLFVAKLMHQVTRSLKWEKIYRDALERRGGSANLSRLEICERGMTPENGRLDYWTSAGSVASLRGLWDMETDAAIKAAFARGLEACAAIAMNGLPLAGKFDPKDTSTFNPNWREMNSSWKPQQTEQEAQTLANQQLREFIKTSPRRRLETAFVREPTSAAWIVTLTPDAQTLQSRAAAIEAVINHYDYTRLHYSQFFWVECAWWRLNH